MALCSSTQAHAGAWLQPEGRGYKAAQASYFSGDVFFDASGAQQSQPRFSKIEANYYAEYGALNWLTVGGNFFVNRASQSGQHNIGIADSELFAKLPLLTYDGWVSSVQPLIKLPSQYQDNHALRAGSRSTDLELSLLTSKPYPLLSDHDFLDSRIGYRIRSRGLASQWRTDIAYTMYLTDALAIIPAYRTILTTEINDGTTFRQDGEQDFDLHRIELGVSWKMDEKTTLLAAAFSHIAGVNAGGGHGITLGAGWNF